MDFLELTKKRFSCRSYESSEVEKEKLDYILECARMAPSAVNRQPWRFRVFTKENGIEKMWDCYDREWFRTAPACIVISLLHDEEWVRADGKRHGDIDVAISTEHVCLAAAEQGLGTCWVCNFNSDLCKDILQMKAEEEPIVLIPIGYPACEATPKNRKPMEEIMVN